MYIIFGSSNVERWVKLIPLKSPKIGSWTKAFLSSDLRVSKNILQIGESRVSKFEFMHILSESKSIFEIEQKAIVSCFVKNVAFLLGHPVDDEIVQFYKRNCPTFNKKITGAR